VRGTPRAVTKVGSSDPTAECGIAVV